MIIMCLRLVLLKFNYICRIPQSTSSAGHYGGRNESYEWHGWLKSPRHVLTTNAPVTAAGLAQTVEKSRVFGAPTDRFFSPA